jgi:hypothetical protein
MVNSQLHGATDALTEISRGYTKLLDSGRITLFMMHTVAGYNHRVIGNWISDHRPEVLQYREDRRRATSARAPRKKRVHRYDDLPPYAGASPPGKQQAFAPLDAAPLGRHQRAAGRIKRGD